jgi:hypothetical protein
MWMSLLRLAAPAEAAEPPPAEIEEDVRHLRRHRTQGWERPTLYTGLGLMGASVVGGVVSFEVLRARCSFECMELLGPVVLGGAGFALGGVVATVGAVGIAAAPTEHDGLAIAIRGRF